MTHQPGIITTVAGTGECGYTTGIWRSVAAR